MLRKNEAPAGGTGTSQKKGSDKILAFLSLSAKGVVLDAALRYHRLTWSVIPLHTPTPNGCSCGKPDCKNAGKHPRVAWSELQQHQVSEEQIRAWWTRWPDANIGILTGAASGLVVVDIDGEAAAAWVREKPIPQTPVACTGKGWHLYFKSPGFAIPNAARLVTFADGGIDIRGGGGLVVAPPSLHASGRRYVWVEGRSPWECSVADLPGWVLELLQRQKQDRKQERDPDWVLELLQGVPQGQRNNTATRLVGHWLGKGLPESEVWFLLREWNARNQPPLPERELEQVFRSIVAREAKKPKKSDAPTEEDPDVVPLATVEPEQVEWLWEPYLPAGKLTILEGDPGAGKTWVALAICARLTAQGYSVLYATCEDGLADTIRPRAEGVDADLARFLVLRGKRGESGETLPFTLADVDVLQKAFETHHPTLLVLDPIQGFLGADVDMHKANEVRARLAAVIRLAEEYGCAVLLVRHLSKAPAARAIYRGLGSIDFAAAARSVLLVGQDQAGSRVLVHLKASLGSTGPSLGFEIRQGRFYWTGEVNVTAGDVLQPEGTQEEKTALEDACEWLQDVLTNGPMDAKQIRKLAREAGLIDKSDILLRRAKQKLGVVAESVKETDKNGRLLITGWRWRLPDAHPGAHQVLTPLRTLNEHLENETAKPRESRVLSRCSSNAKMSIWKECSNDAGLQAQFPDAHQNFPGVHQTGGGGDEHLENEPRSLENQGFFPDAHRTQK